MTTKPKADATIIMLIGNPGNTETIEQWWVTPRRTGASDVALVLKPVNPDSRFAGQVPGVMGLTRLDALALADALRELCGVGTEEKKA
jgi:hypothetical protein